LGIGIRIGKLLHKLLPHILLLVKPPHVLELLLVLLLHQLHLLLLVGLLVDRLVRV